MLNSIINFLIIVVSIVIMSILSLIIYFQYQNALVLTILFNINFGAGAILGGYLISKSVRRFIKDLNK